MRAWLLPLLLLAAARPARAIELALEENKAERGSVGYIDMQRVFKLYPETIKAKESFEETVRQAEEQVSIRKAEVLRLRHEIADLKIERELLARTPLVISSAAAPGAVPAPAPSIAPLPGLETISPTPAPFGAPASTAPIRAPAFAAPASTSPVKPLVINIPGVSTAPIVVQPPAATPPPPPAVAVSSAAAPAAPAPAGPSPALVELDAKIALKTSSLAQKEEDFKKYQAETEKNLLDLESRRTEVLLGKIHKAVQLVARKEGVSIVVDKTSILYGHDAVDLTEKVLKQLKGQ